MSLRKLLLGSLFAGSVFLSNGLEAEDDPKSYSPEKIKEVYKEYKTLCNEAKDRGILTYYEIRDLNDFLEEHLPYMQKEVVNKETTVNSGEADKPIKDLEWKVLFLEEEVLSYFPNLVKKDNSSITYQADKQLEQKYNDIVKGLIKEADKTFKEKGEKKLEDLAKKEQLTIQDLVVFYNILKKSDGAKQSAEDTEDLIGTLVKNKEVCKEYLDSVEEWKKTQPKYISMGPLQFMLDSEDNTALKYKSDIVQPEGISYKKVEEMFDCKVGDITYDIGGVNLIHPGAGIPLGFILPILMKLLVTLYTRRKKWDGYDGVELTVNSGFGNMCDILHPYVFPIRMLATPIITEYLVKNNYKRKK